MKGHRLFIGYSITIFVLIISSCEKDISVKPLPYATKPVIECILKPGDYPKLFLNRSIAYFDSIINNRDFFVRGADVKISSNLGTDILKEDSSFNLFSCQYEYFYSSKNKIAPNITYNLTLIANGETFTATATTNLNKVAITRVDYTSKFNDVYGEHEGVIVDFNDIPGEPDYYRYQMSRMIDSTVTYGETKVYSVCTHGSYFYVKETGRAVYSDKNQDGAPYEIVVEPAYKHKKDAEAYVSVFTVDKNTYDFYDALDRQKLGLLNPFVEPVFLKPVQFKNAIGIFGACALSDSVKFVYPE